MSTYNFFALAKQEETASMSSSGTNTNMEKGCIVSVVG